MPRQPSRQNFPRPALIGAGVVVGIAIAAAGFGAAFGGHGEPPTAPAVAERILRFQDRQDGGIDVFDATQDRQIETITGEQGFLRGTLRSFARTRRQENLGINAPLRLTAYADGRLLLLDPQTGQRLELEAFGSTNLAVFSHYLMPARLTRTGAPPAAGASS